MRIVIQGIGSSTTMRAVIEVIGSPTAQRTVIKVIGRTTMTGPAVIKSPRRETMVLRIGITVPTPRSSERSESLTRNTGSMGPGLVMGKGNLCY